MGTTHPTILVAGDLSDIRAGVSTDGVVLPLGEQQWAVIPRQEGGYAETEEPARHLSRPPGVLTAALPVFDSDIPAAHLSRAGAGNEHRHHELLRALTLWPAPPQSTHVNAASDPEAIRLPG